MNSEDIRPRCTDCGNLINRMFQLDLKYTNLCANCRAEKLDRAVREDYKNDELIKLNKP